MTVPTPDRGAQNPRGHTGFIKLDAPMVSPPSAATDLGQVHERCERVSGGVHGLLDHTALPAAGPATFTIDLLGSKVPFTLKVTIRDDTSGFPGPETTTDYAMGPSNTSQSITLTDANFTCTALYAERLF